MHRKDELKRKIMKLIQDSTDLKYEEKETWSSVFSELSDYQEEMLQCIASPTTENYVKTWNIHCGITCLNESQIGNNRHFMSLADNIKSPVFPDGNILNQKKIPQDGDWFIIGTGYLDCDYEELFKICGRDKSYKGKYSNGEFEYSLVLNNSLLHKEKLLYQISELYGINEPVIYAPMLRRLVYIETKTNLKEKLCEKNLQLEQNGIRCLLGGWRAIWNVEIEESIPGIKTIKGYKYPLDANEYILPIEKYASQIKMSKEYDFEKEQNYVLVSSISNDNPKKYIYKIRLSPINKESDISYADMKLYINRGENNQKITRIFSKSDVFSYMKGYEEVAKCSAVYTEYPKGLNICAYETDFEYPAFSEYFDFSERPTVFISFEKDENKFFFDRIVYIIHSLQRQFPEFIWKGGYFK